MDIFSKLVVVSLVAVAMTTDVAYGCCCWKREKKTKPVEFTIQQEAGAVVASDKNNSDEESVIDAIAYNNLDVVKEFVADDVDRADKLKEHFEESDGILEYALNNNAREVFVYLASLYAQADLGERQEPWLRFLQKIDTHPQGKRVIFWLTQEKVGLGLALWFVQKPEYVEKILKTNVDCERLYKFKMTVLAYAAHKGNTEKVRLLLNKGANIDHQDEYQATALMRAVRGGHVEVVHLLLEKYYDSAEFQTTALYAQELPDSKQKIAQCLSDFSGPFTFLLQESGINLRDKDGHTALWYAQQKLSSAKCDSERALAQKIVAVLENVGAVE